MKQDNSIIKKIVNGVLLTSILFAVSQSFAGGAGPDAGYKIGGSIKDLEVFNEKKRELIVDVTQLPGFKVAMEQLSQLFSYAPQIALDLERTLTSKNWYFAEIPQNDTFIKTERIGRQDDVNIYLSNKYKVFNCQLTCSAEEEKQIRIQGELIYHEMWVAIARMQWNKKKEGHPNQNDVESVVGTLLSQGQSYRSALNPSKALSNLLSEFNFNSENFGGEVSSEIPDMIRFLKTHGVSAKAVYKLNGEIEITFTTSKDFTVDDYSNGLFTLLNFSWKEGFLNMQQFRSPSWRMCGYTTIEKSPILNHGEQLEQHSFKITCNIHNDITLDMDASGNIIVP